MLRFVLEFRLLFYAESIPLSGIKQIPPEKLEKAIISMPAILQGPLILLTTRGASDDKKQLWCAMNLVCMYAYVHMCKINYFYAFTHFT